MRLRRLVEKGREDDNVARLEVVRELFVVLMVVNDLEGIREVAVLMEGV